MACGLSRLGICKDVNSITYVRKDGAPYVRTYPRLKGFSWKNDDDDDDDDDDDANLGLTRAPLPEH